jgi:TetR/AcrR family transcriptional repressor of mexJK operon
VTVDHPSLPTKRSRSLSKEARRKILEAATDVFLTIGYSNASMDTIARQAKVSKNTIYNHFESKDGLFEAIIHEQCQTLLEPLFTPAIRNAEPEIALTLFATRHMTTVLSPTIVSLYRVVVAEVQRFPELGKAFHRAGPQTGIQNLAHYLREQDEKGTLAIANPEGAAERLMGTLVGYKLLRACLGVEATLSPSQRDQYVVEVVGDFLKLYHSNRVSDHPHNNSA